MIRYLHQAVALVATVRVLRRLHGEFGRMLAFAVVPEPTAVAEAT